MKVVIAPSILAADLACLGDEVKRAEEGGCDAFHVDIMDWHFVPNLSFGPNVVETMRKLTELPLDVHLMVDNPLKMIDSFIDAGSDYLTIHTEIPECPEAIDKIKSRGIKAGVSLRPDTPVDNISVHLGKIDLILVMSVYPGFGGQHFIDASYGRIGEIRKISAGYDIRVSVDGGVDAENVCKLVSHGADWIVAGTAVFKDHSATENIKNLRKNIDFNLSGDSC